MDKYDEALTYLFCMAKECRGYKGHNECMFPYTCSDCNYMKSCPVFVRTEILEEVIKQNKILEEEIKTYKNLCNELEKETDKDSRHMVKMLNVNAKLYKENNTLKDEVTSYKNKCLELEKKLNVQ